MSTRPLLLVALLLAGVPSGRAAAGAWLQPEGGIYAKTSWIHLDTGEGYDCRGLERAVDTFGGRYRAEQFLTYVEWGAREWLTVVGSWGYKDQRIVDAAIPDYGTRSTGDLQAGARLPLRRGQWPVSVQILASLPTYPETRLSDPVAEREQFLPAGSGQAELELRLQSGVSLHPLPLYANLDLAHRRRGGDFGDQWRVAAELGGATERLFVKTELSWALPTESPCVGEAAAGDVAVHERRVQLAPELAVRVRGAFWWNAGFSTALAGRNGLAGTQWSTGISWIRR